MALLKEYGFEGMTSIVEVLEDRKHLVNFACYDHSSFNQLALAYIKELEKDV